MSECVCACACVNIFRSYKENLIMSVVVINFFPVGIMKLCLACCLVKSMWKTGKRGKDSLVLGECDPLLLFPDVRDQACTEKSQKLKLDV